MSQLDFVASRSYWPGGKNLGPEGLSQISPGRKAGFKRRARFRPGGTAGLSGGSAALYPRLISCEPPGGWSGFTLTELLVVVAIMILLIGLIAPTASQILRGSYVTQSGDMVGDQLALARQSAMASNRRVQVRFYGLPVPGVSGSNNFSAIQSFRIEENGSATALTKLQTLSTRVIFVNDVAHSSIIATTNPLPTVQGTSQLPAYGNQTCSYVGFQFMPDGSTDLSTTPPAGSNGWFLTLVDGTRPIPASGQPTNFYTLRVEPLNGHTRVFRP